MECRGRSGEVGTLRNKQKFGEYFLCIVSALFCHCSPHVVELFDMTQPITSLSGIISCEQILAPPFLPFKKYYERTANNPLQPATRLEGDLEKTTSKDQLFIQLCHLSVRGLILRKVYNCMEAEKITTVDQCRRKPTLIVPSFSISLTHTHTHTLSLPSLSKFPPTIPTDYPSLIDTMLFVRQRSKKHR